VILPANLTPGRDRFLHEIKTYFEKFSPLETAEFEIIHVAELAGAPLTLRVDIRYDFVATLAARPDVPSRGACWNLADTVVVRSIARPLK